MKISIITAVKDDLDGFIQTAVSVCSQSYKEIEYIVVDASEKSKIREKCPEYLSKIDKFIEGPDSSPFEGMNRGIEAATGDVITLLHAGDIYVSSEIISQVAGMFTKTDIDVLYGNIVFHSKTDTDKIVRTWTAKKITKDSVSKGIFPPHTSLFLKKEVYEKCGKFNLKYKIAADSDFMFKLFYINEFKSLCFDETILSMRIGGRSNKSLISVIKSNYEFFQAARNAGISHPAFSVIRKMLSKIGQYF